MKQNLIVAAICLVLGAFIGKKYGSATEIKEVEKEVVRNNVVTVTTTH